jgi:arabinose-5-phosphate isomerase
MADLHNAPLSAVIDPAKLLELGVAVIETEAQAVAGLKKRIDQNFLDACTYILNCRGRTVVLGMGKSGHVGGKIAATLASTGTPAFFVHPGEASHGDLGMITSADVVIALSNSGETEEIITLLPMIRRLNVPLISLTGNPASTLAREASINIDISVPKEACPLGLSPTASTTASLVMGDALAVALLEARGFNSQDFARSHPGGRLGRRLLLHVSDIMHSGAAMPKVHEDRLLGEVLMEMTQKGLGTAAVVDHENRVLGIYTDGDLRRTLDHGIDIHTARAGDVMTRQCKTVSPTRLAAEALSMMENYKINALLVVDDDNHLIGVLNMHDLLKARVV